MEPVSVKDLKERLKKEKTIEICGMNFRIRQVPLLLLAEDTENLWSVARESRDVLTGRIKDMVANPTLSRMRRILLSGVIQPRLANQDDDDAVSVDLILTNHELSTGLFIEIINFSFEPSKEA